MEFRFQAGRKGKEKTYKEKGKPGIRGERRLFLCVAGSTVKRLLILLEKEQENGVNDNDHEHADPATRAPEQAVEQPADALAASIDSLHTLGNGIARRDGHLGEEWGDLSDDQVADAKVGAANDDVLEDGALGDGRDECKEPGEGEQVGDPEELVIGKQHHQQNAHRDHDEGGGQRSGLTAAECGVHAEVDLAVKAFLDQRVADAVGNGNKVLHQHARHHRENVHDRRDRHGYTEDTTPTVEDAQILPVASNANDKADEQAEDSRIAKDLQLLLDAFGVELHLVQTD